MKAKTEEIEQKKGEVETMLARTKEAALVTGRAGQRCSYCHQKNHTVRSCVEENVNLHSFVVTCQNTLMRNWLSRRRNASLRLWNCPLGRVAKS